MLQGRIKINFTDLLVLLFSILFGIWCSLNRLVARDEGFYTYAIELVSKGFVPYKDFFYPQMPFLPYLYSFPTLIFGSDWLIMRQTSGIIFGLIIFISYLIIKRETNYFWGIIGALLVSTCHLSYAWFSVVQTYGLSVLSVLLGLYFTTAKEKIFFNSMLAGVCMALATSVRLFFLPLLIIPLMLFYFHRRPIFAYILGVLIVFFPLAFFALLDPEQFWFNNLGYHLIRSDLEDTKSLANKWRIFEVLFSLGRPTVQFSGFQTPILFGVLFLSLPFIVRSSLALSFASLAGLFLFILSFIPTPSYIQYFSCVVPFLVIVFVLFLNQIFSTTKYKITASLVLIIFIFTYLFHLPQDIERYTKTGQGVIGIGDIRGAKEWNLKSIYQIREIIKSNSAPNETIAAFWPGYLVGTDRKILQGMENHFGVLIADKLDLEEQNKMKIISNHSILKLLNDSQIPLVVFHSRTAPRGLAAALQKINYSKFKQVGRIQIWKR